MRGVSRDGLVRFPGTGSWRLSSAETGDLGIWRSGWRKGEFEDADPAGLEVRPRQVVLGRTDRPVRRWSMTAKGWIWRGVWSGKGRKKRRWNAGADGRTPGIGSYHFYNI